MVLKTERLTDDIRSGHIKRLAKEHFRLKNAKRIILILVSSILLLSVLMWIAARRFSSVECTQWTLAEEEIYTDQCPFTYYWVPRVAEVAKENGIFLKTVHITDKETAQNLPAPVLNYALFYDGGFITHAIQSDKKFLEIADKCLNSD